MIPRKSGTCAVRFKASGNVPSAKVRSGWHPWVLISLLQESQGNQRGREGPTRLQTPPRDQPISPQVNTSCSFDAQFPAPKLQKCGKLCQLYFGSNLVIRVAVLSLQSPQIVPRRAGRSCCRFCRQSKFARIRIARSCDEKKKVLRRAKGGRDNML